MRRYRVRVPELLCCNTQGDIREEAQDYAIEEAFKGYLETLKELGRPTSEEAESPLVVVISITT